MMTHRKIEYVFGPPRPSTGHSLGVSALALSTELVVGPGSHGTLVSGGRDGRLNAWALGPNSHHGNHNGQAHAIRVQDMHTNWVSAIVVQSPETVVSSSADTTVKLWNVRHNVVATLGHHRDYAQCLARLDSSRVVSGGLDGRILGWDVNTGHKTFEIFAKQSVYSVAALSNSDTDSQIVVSGTYDGTVSVWDSRMPTLNSYKAKEHGSKPVAIFRGHTDNVRCLATLDSDTLISGSSDASVKVWSLRAGRILRSFNQFHSSVWSLQSSTPASLNPRKVTAPSSHGSNGFWAGDRDGNIYHTPSIETEPRVVIEHGIKEGGLAGLCPDPVTGNLWVSTPFSPNLRCLDSHNGSVVSSMRGHSGLRKHRVLNDKRRVLVADTAGRVRMVDLVSAKLVAFERHVDLSTADIDAEMDKILAEVNTMDVLDSWCHVEIKTGEICVTLDHRSVNNTEVYLDDLQNHVGQIAKTPLPTPQESPQTSPFNTPGTTPMASPMTSPHNSGFFRQGRSPFVSPAVSRVTSTQSMADLASGPGHRPRKSLGTGKGNAKFYDPGDDDEEERDETARASAANLLRPLTQLHPQAAHAPTTTSAPPAPPSTSAYQKKVSADETEEPADAQTADDEIRINLGNFVLENLMRGVVDRLRQEYSELPAPVTAVAAARATSLSPIASKSTGQTEASEALTVKSEKKRTRFFNKIFGRKKDEEDSSASASVMSGAGSSTAASAGQRSASSNHNASTSTNSSKSNTNTSTGGAGSNPDSSNLNAQQQKQKQQQQQQSIADSSSFQESWSRVVANRSLQSADPESPTPDVLSRRARVVVTEIAPGAGAPTEIFSTTVGRLIHNKVEVEKIERVLPGWVGDAVLMGKLNLKAPTKIGFAVLPATAELPDLTTEATRLMAISMLRVRKIMAYTVGQLQQKGVLSAAASNYAPEEIIRLTCQNTEVTALTTLATVRTRIWRKGGDVGMQYSLKKKI